MRIRSQSRLRYAWAFAIFWNLVSAPATFLGAVPAIEKGQPLAWIALLFPFAGSLLLIWAARLTLRWWRFGASWIDIDGSAVLGGALRARIGAERLPRDSAVQLGLTCIHRTVTGTGSDRSTWEKIVWQEEQVVEPGALQPGPDGDVVPVSFQLPFDVPASRDDDPRDGVLWRLRARARLAGVDYEEAFEIPVAAAPPGKAPAHDATSSARTVPARPPASRISVDTDPDGGTRFTLAAGRNPGVTAGLASFTLLFAGSGAFFQFLTRREHPNPFTWLAFGVIGSALALFVLLLLVLTLHSAFLRTSVTASARALEVRSRACGLYWRMRLGAEDVAGITLKIGMQMGNRPYYDLKVTRRSGAPPVTISTMLRDKREAEWLAAEVSRCLSRETRSPAA